MAKASIARSGDGLGIYWSCVPCTDCLPPFLQGAESGDEETSLTADLRDLEFKLLHDLAQLQVRVT